MRLPSALKFFLDNFTAGKTTYSHRNRTIEIVAEEQGLDIHSLEEETRAMIKSVGRIETISNLRKRFHLTLSAAWRFVDKLDLN